MWCEACCACGACQGYNAVRKVDDANCKGMLRPNQVQIMKTSGEIGLEVMAPRNEAPKSRENVSYQRQYFRRCKISKVASNIQTSVDVLWGNARLNALPGKLRPVIDRDEPCDSVYSVTFSCPLNAAKHLCLSNFAVLGKIIFLYLINNTPSGNAVFYLNCSIIPALEFRLVKIHCYILCKFHPMNLQVVYLKVMSYLSN